MFKQWCGVLSGQNDKIAVEIEKIDPVYFLILKSLETSLKLQFRYYFCVLCFLSLGNLPGCRGKKKHPTASSKQVKNSDATFYIAREPFASFYYYLVFFGGFIALIR